jgi:hypothetical protein
MQKSFKIDAYLATFRRSSVSTFLAWLDLPYPGHDAALRGFAAEFLRDGKLTVGLTPTRERHLRHRLVSAFRHFVAAQELRAQPALQSALWQTACQRHALHCPKPAPPTHESLALQLLHDLETAHTQGHPAHWQAAQASLERLHAAVATHIHTHSSVSLSLSPSPSHSHSHSHSPSLSPSQAYLQHRLQLDHALATASAYPLPPPEKADTCLQAIADMVQTGTWLLDGQLQPHRFRRCATMLARHGRVEALQAFQARWARRLPQADRVPLRQYVAALLAFCQDDCDTAESALNRLLNQVREPEFRLDIRLGLMRLYRARASFMDMHLLPAQAEAIRQFLRRKRTLIDAAPYLEAVRYYLRDAGEEIELRDKTLGEPG